MLTSVRTVVAMNGQERERARYKSVLHEAYEVGVSSGTLTATSLGTVCMCMCRALSMNAGCQL